MKIVYDARFTRFDFPDGLTRYGASIMAELAKIADVTMLINDERQLDLLPDLPWVKVNAPTSISELWVARKINKLNPDVVVSPLQTMGSWGRDYALILTCQDLTYYQFPQAPGFLPKPVQWLWFLYHQMYWPQRILLNRPEIVATISRTTERLMRKHRFTKKPIRLVSNAPQPAEPRDPGAGHDMSLVYMGSFMPYKNAETIMRAAPLLPEFTIHLLSGIRPEREAELRALAPEATNVVFHRGVTDQEYDTLLRRATALVTLSKSEGFGLPLIEAMQVGTPVIASDTEIFREVGADAVRFVPAEDHEAFARAAKELKNDGEWLASSQRGLERATAYSWRDSAAALRSAAGEALSLRSRRRTTRKTAN